MVRRQRPPTPTTLLLHGLRTPPPPSTAVRNPCPTEPPANATSTSTPPLPLTLSTFTPECPATTIANPPPARSLLRPFPHPTLALLQPQNEHIELHQKRNGYRYDHFEKARKKEARTAHKMSQFAQKVHGLRAKLYNEKRFKEKAAMKKKIAIHAERDNKHANDDAIPDGAVPAYLLDREGVSRAKVLSNTIKQKRKEKAGKWTVPIPQVRAIADDEMFRAVVTGKRKKKSWKRQVTKVSQ